MKKDNHQKLGSMLELFMTDEEAPGMPFYLPKGMAIRNELERFWREEHEISGYEEIKTPLLMKQQIWERSGHWQHYHENMYFAEVDDQRYALKPMNCPGAIKIFNHKLRSYKELPIRFAELGLVHRHELSGSLNGLLRVRSFTQDDAHLFVREDQIEDEIRKVLKMIDIFYKRFGFDYKIELSTRPDEYMGSLESWNEAEIALKNVLHQNGVPFALNEGDGAFYGPKIDFHILDNRGRSWQCGTVQLDFQMGEVFDCQYVGNDQKLHRPINIHRAIYGSLERFLGILVEHYDGAFPAWLAPVQVKVINVADAHLPYAEHIYDLLKKNGIKAEFDNRSEKMGLKIREATLKKVPYMLIIGDHEQNSGKLTIRVRGEQQQDQLELDQFIQIVKNAGNWK